MQVQATQTLNFTIRNFRWDDLDQVTEVLAAEMKAIGEMVSVSAETLRMEFTAPGMDAERDLAVAELPDGRVVGLSMVEFDEAGKMWCDCAVHPDFLHHGIGAALIQHSEAYVLQRAEHEVPPEKPIAIDRIAVDTQKEAHALFETFGYTPKRAYYVMQIDLDLDQPLEVPPLPEGIELRPYDPSHKEQVHAVHMETFLDHWNYDQMPLDEWAHYVHDAPNTDPVKLWQIAWDGDQIAAVSLNRYQDSPDGKIGWIGSLGVRRPWRKQGLAQALLVRSFEGFRQQGIKTVGLAVDSSSLTNAVALYERAGMHVHTRRLMVRKMLRGQDPDPD